MNRTFIVGDCAQDDFGQWTTDEVTGEQGCIDGEHALGHGTTMSVLGNPDYSRAAG